MATPTCCPIGPEPPSFVPWIVKPKVPVISRLLQLGEVLCAYPALEAAAASRMHAARNRYLKKFVFIKFSSHRFFSHRSSVNVFHGSGTVDLVNNVARPLGFHRSQRAESRPLPLLVCKKIFDGGVKHRVRDGADDAASRDFLFRGLADNEARGAADAECGGVSSVLLYIGFIVLPIQTRTETGHIQRITLRHF